MNQQVILAVWMGRLSNVSGKNALSPPPSHRPQRVSASWGAGEESSGVLFPKLGRGGVKHWDAWMVGAGIRLLPHVSSWLPQPLPPLPAAKDSQGTWQAQAATRRFGNSTTAWACSQASKVDPESSHFPEEVARFQRQLLVVQDGVGSPRPHPPGLSRLTIT